MSWLPAYRALFERLSIEQRLVIRDTARAYGKSDDTIVVRAPAGSGKTGVIVALFAYLVNEGIAKPCDLVLSTFTRKARGVMLLRLSGLTDERNVRGAAGIRVATFHGLAYMGVLRVAGINLDGKERTGRPSSHKHLADFKHRWSQSLNLDASPMERAKVEIPKGATEHAQIIRWLSADKLIESICTREIPGLPRSVPSVKKFTGVAISPKALANFIQAIRAGGLEDQIPEVTSGRREYEGFPGSEIHGDSKEVKGLAYGWKLYEEAKRSLGMWDFADSLAVYRKIVEAGGDTARMFVVDEAQDSTFVQRAVARGMVAVGRSEGPSTLVLVGDPRQSIYQFVGADPTQLVKDTGTDNEDGGKISAIDLRTNYRSAADIVSFANVVCEGEDWAPAPAVASAAPTAEDRVILLTGPGTDHESERDRGYRVIEMIQAGISAGIAPGNYCILSRTWEPLGFFEGLLRNKKIPFRMLGDGGSFFYQPLVKFVVGVLRLAHGIGEPEEVNSAFVQSLRYFGEYLCDPQAVFKVQTQTMTSILGWRAPQSGDNPKGRALRALALWQRDELRRKFGKGGDRAGEGRVMLWKPAHETAFADYLKILGEAGQDRPLSEVYSRIKAILLGRLEDDDDRERLGVLGVMIDSLTTGALPELLEQANGTESRGTTDDDDPERVSLSTIHSMKGREARIVFLLCGPTETPWHGEDTPEERRVFYVGATRAQDYLLLCATVPSGEGTKSKEDLADYLEYFHEWKNLKDSPA